MKAAIIINKPVKSFTSLRPVIIKLFAVYQGPYHAADLFTLKNKA